MKNWFYIILLLFFLCGCEFPFDPKLDGMNSQYSVEGFVTTDSVKQSVKLFYTKSYESTNSFEPITTADVSVIEIQNGTVTNTFSYTYIDSLRKYISSNVFKAMPGYIYRLQVKIGTDEIVAEDTMKSFLYLDSIRFKLMPSFKIFEDGSYKDILLIDVVCFAQEPAGGGDAYVWNTYWNDTLLTDSLRKKLFQNDMMVDGNYIIASEVSSAGLFPVDSGWNTTIPFGTKLTVTTSHVNNAYFMYILNIMLSTEWRAGPFSGPPANPQGNVFLNGEKSGVYGYFATEAITRNTIYFNPLEVIFPSY